MAKLPWTYNTCMLGECRNAKLSFDVNNTPIVSAVKRVSDIM